jgi:hypothetical protein
VRGRRLHPTSEEGQSSSTAITQWKAAPINRPKLDDIARRINEASRNAALDLAYSVGELIIRELYDGDLALWGRHGTRSPSYQHLASRSDLLLTPTALCRAIGVYALCERHGGRGSWPKLSVSHLREVLALQPPQQERLLRTADAEGWTVSQLRQEIAKRRPKKKRDKPRNLANTVIGLKAFVAERREHLFNPNGFKRLDGETAQAIRQTLSSLRQELKRIEKQLGRMVPSGPPSQRP